MDTLTLILKTFEVAFFVGACVLGILTTRKLLSMCKFIPDSMKKVVSFFASIFWIVSLLVLLLSKDIHILQTKNIWALYVAFGIAIISDAIHFAICNKESIKKTLNVLRKSIRIFKEDIKDRDVGVEACPHYISSSYLMISPVILQ